MKLLYSIMSNKAYTSRKPYSCFDCKYNFGWTDIMFESFKIIFLQMLVLFAFIAIGYTLKKFGKLSEAFNKGVSNLLVYILVPFLIFESMSKNFKIDVLWEKKDILLISVLMLLAFLLIAFVYSRVLTKNRDTRDIYMYSFSFPNSGYFGNPLVLAIFGELMLFDYIIFTIPFLILTYTFGIYTLDPNKTFQLKKLINPIIIALVLGMIVGALNIKIPQPVSTVISMGSNCMAPMAMILTGVVFASKDLKSMLSNPKVYIACITKMLVLPLIVVIIMSRFKIPENVAALIVPTLTLPTGMNSIVFPEANGGDCKTGAQLCLISTVLCLIAFPLVYSFYLFLCQ